MINVDGGGYKQSWTIQLEYEYLHVVQIVVEQ
jgi:hypothetical protein